MKRWHRRIVWGGILIVGLMVAFLGIGNKEWKKLNEVEKYKNIFANSITEITLRETIDHPEYVRFSDEDLINLWSSYFYGVEVKEYFSFLENMQEKNGGGKVIEIQTEEGEVVLVEYYIANELMLDINGTLYKIREKDDMPFKESYNIAAERYGTYSVFD